MAFTPETFVLCSKFNLFKAHANLWIYTTNDTLDDCLAEHYFQPRLNLKNQDSPEVGDVIQCIVEGSKLAYLKIVGKTEKPYYITVARTFLENEAVIIAELAEMANKTTDFSTPITDENLGITQAEQAELEDKIDLAANSGRMITSQGLWYAKMYSATVAPSAEDGTNYADFSQVDGEGNPIIVTYNRVSGVWVQDQTITPPAEYDGYVPITSKIWDIPEQDGQQGGRILWNHVSKEFTPYPQIISFDSVELTGDSTVVMPVNPDGDNIANVDFVLDHMTAKNIGDIFYTCRTDPVLNGAVPCDGNTYQTTDYSGAQAPGALLQAGKLPYVSLATYASLLATNGSVGVFGWDGIGTTAFKVPTLTDIFLETGTVAQIGDYVAPSLPNVKGVASNVLFDTFNLNTQNGCIKVTSGSTGGNGGGSYARSSGTITVDASTTSAVYNDNTTTVQPNTVRYRAMIQLSVGVSDQSLANLATVAYTGDYGDLLNKPTIPTLVSQLTNDAGYIDSIKTINNNSLVGSGNLELSTYLQFASGWPTTGTTKLFCDAIAADTSAVKGKAYLGEVTFSDLPGSMANGEAIVEIMDGTTAANKVIVLTLNSGNVAPYMWRYTYWNQGNDVSGWQTWATSAQGAKADTAVQPGDLATVATTGAYSDLTGTPTIPAAQVNSDWNASSGVAEILNKPTIPTVNNSTITITQGGVTKGSFTTNQGSASTIALDAGGGSGSTDSLFVNATVIGSPNINGSIVDGLTTTSYLETPIEFNFSNATSFEVGGSFTTASDISKTQYLTYRTTQNSRGLIISVSSTKLKMVVSNSGLGIQLTGDTVLTANTKYWFKVTYNGTSYVLSLSTDGINYTTDGSTSGTVAPPDTDMSYYIGWSYAASDNSVVPVSELQMENWYAKKNGSIIWRGAVGHKIIAFQQPTASNNYTWYRKYDDGWVEQGGYVADRQGSVVLPVTMSDANYMISQTLRLSGSVPGSAQICPYVKNVSATGFDYYNNPTGTVVWQVSGMAA